MFLIVAFAFSSLSFALRIPSDDTASTYYEDYDPFDYIYSGGTQYSDPVYEAVSRSDRTPLSPNSSGSGPPPAPGWNVSSAYGFGEPDLEMDPPPLPPRNSDLYHPMMGAVTAAAVGNEPSSSAGNYEVMQRKTIERRPAPTKLYENVVIKKSYDRELIAFYEMVKHLRGKTSSWKFSNHILMAVLTFQNNTAVTIREATWVTWSRPSLTITTPREPVLSCLCIRRSIASRRTTARTRARSMATDRRSRSPVIVSIALGVLTLSFAVNYLKTRLREHAY